IKKLLIEAFSMTTPFVSKRELFLHYQKGSNPLKTYEFNMIKRGLRHCPSASYIFIYGKPLASAWRGSTGLFSDLIPQLSDRQDFLFPPPAGTICAEAPPNCVSNRLLPFLHNPDSYTSISRTAPL